MVPTEAAVVKELGQNAPSRDGFRSPVGQSSDTDFARFVVRDKTREIGILKAMGLPSPAFHRFGRARVTGKRAKAIDHEKSIQDCRNSSSK